ncbi:NAD kinase [Geofilum rubicundum]|uniref:NAD kinase n=1 Tax=Geofilum rubicundum JCM 15548 TaxID=1236989 RepID=A0A0E9LZE4_9BACT|nr:NAD kinase [Geofilum rubicundum]GAO30932.1 NAD kinase [Geofilum rubicundum JCM 15548]
MRIAIFGKQFGEVFYERCSTLLKHLALAKAEMIIHKPFYDFLVGPVGLNPKVAGFFKDHDDLPDCEMMFSIGGDGTFLDAVTMVRNRQIPIVGINSGRLGFLADISQEELPLAVAEIMEGQFVVRELDLLKLETSIPCFGDLDFALNEMAVQKRDSSSMITIHTYLNGDFLNSYWADGLIVSTSTGSTAYSLSVGGPIMHPASQNFIINPIAPHNLTVRPLVVPNSFELKLRIEARGGKFLASLDSRSCILDESVELKVRKADFSVPVVERIGKTFYSTLRSKLMWGADKRN